MLNVIEIKDFNAPELDIYARCTEARLLNKDHPEEGMFIAESPKVIGRALDAGYEPLSVLVEKKQMTPYGIRLFPHRKEHNHFVGPVWPVWESGFASAAAESQNKELLLTMIAQQMRTAVLHKNFHEVLEADTGKSWRWPGQLWHACGFAAQILYGVFGISYDEQGMRFNPCVPEIFKEIEIQNLNYQSAKLTVKISGTGTVECVILDDEKVDFIPYSLTGNHIVHIKLTETESECI